MAYSYTDREVNFIENFAPLVKTQNIMSNFVILKGTQNKQDQSLSEIKINNFSNLFKKVQAKKHKLEKSHDKNDNSGQYFTSINSFESTAKESKCLQDLTQQYYQINLFDYLDVQQLHFSNNDFTELKSNLKAYSKYKIISLSSQSKKQESQLTDLLKYISFQYFSQLILEEPSNFDQLIDRISMKHLNLNEVLVNEQQSDVSQKFLDQCKKLKNFYLNEDTFNSNLLKIIEQDKVFLDCLVYIIKDIISKYISLKLEKQQQFYIENEEHNERQLYFLLNAKNEKQTDNIKQSYLNIISYALNRQIELYSASSSNARINLEVYPQQLIKQNDNQLNLPHTRTFSTLNNSHSIPYLLPKVQKKIISLFQFSMNSKESDSNLIEMHYTILLKEKAKNLLNIKSTLENRNTFYSQKKSQMFRQIDPTSKTEFSVDDDFDVYQQSNKENSKTNSISKNNNCIWKQLKQINNLSQLTTESYTAIKIGELLSKQKEHLNKIQRINKQSLLKQTNNLINTMENNNQKILELTVQASILPITAFQPQPQIKELLYQDHQTPTAIKPAPCLSHRTNPQISFHQVQQPTQQVQQFYYTQIQTAAGFSQYCQFPCQFSSRQASFQHGSYKQPIQNQFLQPKKNISNYQQKY